MHKPQFRVIRSKHQLAEMCARASELLWRLHSRGQRESVVPLGDYVFTGLKLSNEEVRRYLPTPNSDVVHDALKVSVFLITPRLDAIIKGPGGFNRNKLIETLKFCLPAEEGIYFPPYSIVPAKGEGR